jgi:threonine/homoserine/homoserine lactone efflux protein
VLFDLLRVIGAAVLVVLGVQVWCSSVRNDEDGFGGALTTWLPGRRTPLAAFRASLISVVANPKAAVFGLSFFPQFLPRSGSVLLAVVALASIQVVVDSAWCVSLVLLAGRARAWLSRARIRQRIERGLGVILIAFGAELAIDTR